MKKTMSGFTKKINNSCQMTRCVQEGLRELFTKSHLVEEGDSENHENEDDEPSISSDGSFTVRFLKDRSGVRTVRFTCCRLTCCLSFAKPVKLDSTQSKQT